MPGPASARVGLIAGAGDLPAQAAEGLAAEGRDVFAIGFEGITDPGLVRTLPALVSLPLGQLETLLAELVRAQCDEILLVGKFEASALSTPGSLFRPDALALEWLASSKDRSDDGLMEILAEGLASHDLTLLDQREVLRPLLAEAGPLNAVEAGPEALSDLSAARALRASGRWPSAAQSLALKDGVLVAEEGRAGTDELILRSGQVAGPGTTIVKATREAQDLRIDLPTIGPGTIAAMVEASATTLAIEASTTILVARDRCLAAADRAGISILGFSFEASP